MVQITINDLLPADERIEIETPLAEEMHVAPQPPEPPELKTFVVEASLSGYAYVEAYDIVEAKEKASRLTLSNFDAEELLFVNAVYEEEES
jgi:hypothetical protein